MAPGQHGASTTTYEACHQRSPDHDGVCVVNMESIEMKGLGILEFSNRGAVCYETWGGTIACEKFIAGADHQQDAKQERISNSDE